MPFAGVQTCARSEEHTSELQSHDNLVCRLLLEKKTRPGPTRSGHRGSHPSCSVTGRAVAPGAVIRRQGGRRVQQRGCEEVNVRLFFFFKERGPPDLSPLPPQGALPF